MHEPFRCGRRDILRCLRSCFCSSTCFRMMLEGSDQRKNDRRERRICLGLGPRIEGQNLSKRFFGNLDLVQNGDYFGKLLRASFPTAPNLIFIMMSMRFFTFSRSSDVITTIWQTLVNTRAEFNFNHDDQNLSKRFFGNLDLVENGDLYWPVFDHLTGVVQSRRTLTQWYPVDLRVLKCLEILFNFVRLLKCTG